MTSASMTFGRPARLTVPRGALWFAAAAGAVIGALRRLDQWQLKVSRQEPQTAEDVIAWANRIQSSDPGFANDLRSAALRSMGQKD